MEAEADSTARDLDETHDWRETDLFVHLQPLSLQLTFFQSPAYLTTLSTTPVQPCRVPHRYRHI